jgi:5-formyltetrahydrofolate cyclo-ligase
MSTSIASLKRQLRKQLRQRRRALHAVAQAAAGRALRDRLLHNSDFLRSHNIAFYLPADGEIDTRPLIAASLDAGKHLYLPVIDGGEMRFHAYRRDTRLVQSDFGLWQPDTSEKTLPALELDLVIMPLVGFDRRGGRLGMGGGYYDRAFRNAPKRGARPRLVGVAHGIQELEQVPLERWDRKLHAVATDREYIRVG